MTGVCQRKSVGKNKRCSGWVIRTPRTFHHDLQLLGFRRLLPTNRTQSKKRQSSEPREKPSAPHGRTSPNSVFSLEIAQGVYAGTVRRGNGWVFHRRANRLILSQITPVLAPSELWNPRWTLSLLLKRPGGGSVTRYRVRDTCCTLISCVLRFRSTSRCQRQVRGVAVRQRSALRRLP
jgi:hypothetical protein